MVGRNQYRPIPAHEAMLQAAFLKHAGAEIAWNQWKPGVHDWDHLDLLSFRLMPQLYYNLRELGLEDSHMNLLKGVCRKTWYNNQVYLTHVARSLRPLAERDIPIMLLFGGALTVRHYPDYALFPAVDFSILVPPSQVTQAIAQLQASGWRPDPPIPASQIDSYLTSHFSHLLRDDSGRRMMLHWHALSQFCGSDMDQRLWDDAEELDLYGVPVLTPSPTKQLLLLCGQYSSVQGASLFLRVMDGTMLLRVASDRIDWSQLLHLAQENGLILSVRDALTYAQQHLELQTPQDFQNELQKVSASPTEDSEHRLLTHRKTWFSRAALLWLFYSRRRRGDILAKLMGFPEFLRRRWRLPSRWALPTFAVRASWQLLWPPERKSKV